MATKEKNKRAGELRLIRKYGYTAAEKQILLEMQGGVCAICFKPPKNLAFAMDHDHKAAYIKVAVVRDAIGFYIASAVYLQRQFRSVHAKRNQAVRLVRLQLKRASVRGLLCHAGCNSGLRKFADDPERLLAAGRYLQAHRDRKIDLLLAVTSLKPRNLRSLSR